MIMCPVQMPGGKVHWFSIMNSILVSTQPLDILSLFGHQLPGGKATNHGRITPPGRGTRAPASASCLLYIGLETVAVLPIYPCLYLDPSEESSWECLAAHLLKAVTYDLNPILSCAPSVPPQTLQAVLVMAGIVALILVRTVRRDLQKWVRGLGGAGRATKMGGAG